MDIGTSEEESIEGEGTMSLDEQLRIIEEHDRETMESIDWVRSSYKEFIARSTKKIEEATKNKQWEWVAIFNLQKMLVESKATSLNLEALNFESISDLSKTFLKLNYGVIRLARMMPDSQDVRNLREEIDRVTPFIPTMKSLDDVLAKIRADMEEQKRNESKGRGNTP